MDLHDFAQTTIGEDCLRTGETYPIDSLLDYLSGLIKMRKENAGNPVWLHKYNMEIQAVKQVLEKQTA